MLLDGRSLPPGTALRGEVCVIGAGAAGITLARQLAEREVSVVLLESGGLEYEADTQDLYAGTARGEALPGDDAYLVASRQRYFGGTTNHWSGWCRPLDPIDFEQRPWVEHSGWPFSRSHLDPYYQRAAQVLQIVPFDYRTADLVTARQPDLCPAGDPLETSFFHVSPPTRFGQVYRQDLVDATSVRVITHANVLSIDAVADGGHIERLSVTTLEGNCFEVRAGLFILATGGIENARLLLLSDDVHKPGLGNQNDLVGRYFMEHPHLDESFASFPRRLARMNLYMVHHEAKILQKVQGALRVADRRQREDRLLNAVIAIGRPKGADKPPLKWEVTRLGEDLKALGEPRPAKAADYVGRVAVAFEHSPNPDSRVTLTEKRDALGQRRVRLDWRLRPQDIASCLASYEIFGREMGQRGLGRIRYQNDPEHPWALAIGSWHHMGTTRMHADPKQGVVDPDCRIHGIANLYVAGSSVFPTCGCSNPTLTLVALALRLGDHLIRQLRE